MTRPSLPRAGTANDLVVEVTGVRFTDERFSVPRVSELIEPLRKQARRKGVQSVSATLSLGGQLRLDVEVQERGARMKVPGVGLYAFSVEGVLRALGDVIRVQHGGDPMMLDLYQGLLERGL